MKLITTSEFVKDKTNCVSIEKHSSVSGACFYHNNDDYSIIIERTFYRDYWKLPKIKYYRLTDDEVRDMIIPRIV